MKHLKGGLLTGSTVTICLTVSDSLSLIRKKNGDNKFLCIHGSMNYDKSSKLSKPSPWPTPSPIWQKAHRCLCLWETDVTTRWPPHDGSSSQYSPLCAVWPRCSETELLGHRQHHWDHPWLYACKASSATTDSTHFTLRPFAPLQSGRTHNSHQSVTTRLQKWWLYRLCCVTKDFSNTHFPYQEIPEHTELAVPL